MCGQQNCWECDSCPIICITECHFPNAYSPFPIRWPIQAYLTSQLVRPLLDCIPTRLPNIYQFCLFKWAKFTLCWTATVLIEVFRQNSIVYLTPNWCRFTIEADILNHSRFQFIIIEWNCIRGCFYWKKFWIWREGIWNGFSMSIRFAAKKSFDLAVGKLRNEGSHEQQSVNIAQN